MLGVEVAVQISLAFGREVKRIHPGAVDQPGVFELRQSLADVTGRDPPEHFVSDQHLSGRRHRKAVYNVYNV